ncbi:MAG: ketosteroid isomerase-like protein [Saprospiraceae bacterium]|jgi:ketosteroid isomerase-like protein
MKNLNLITCLAVTLLFFFSCTTPPVEPIVDMDSVKTEITAMEAAFTTASNAKDVDALMAYYADDAHSMAPNKPTLIGKDAIKADAVADMTKDTIATSSTMAVTDLWAAGNMAVETGTWTVTDKGGKVVNKGKYMSLFENRDGKYVCIRDIWNTDMPKKEAPMAEAVSEDMEE